MSLPTVAAARPYCVSQIAAVRPLVRGRGGAISGLKYSTCGRGNSHVSVLLHKSIDRHVVRWYRTSGATVPTSSTFLSSSASISSIGGALATETSRVWSGARWPAWRWNESRRDMSTRKRRPGEDPALTDPTRQDIRDENAPKAPTLGKGQDLMSDDPGARPKCVIAGYDIWGFQLTDGVDVRGSMIALPNSYLHWAPKHFEDITIESLRLFELVRPKIDLLIIGVGERITERLDPKLMKHFASKGILIEQLDSVNACSTFNVLNAEDRRVAAALLVLSSEEPPLPADFDAENKTTT